MKKSRFTESQIVAILKEGDAGVPVAEIARKHGISRNTYFNWKARYSGATVSDLRRLKELEAAWPGTFGGLSVRRVQRSRLPQSRPAPKTCAVWSS